MAVPYLGVLLLIPALLHKPRFVQFLRLLRGLLVRGGRKRLRVPRPGALLRTQELELCSGGRRAVVLLFANLDGGVLLTCWRHCGVEWSVIATRMRSCQDGTYADRALLEEPSYPYGT
jgi:hypothetical protein